MLIKKYKPKLVEPTLISNLWKRKNIIQQSVLPPPEPDIYRKLGNKIQNNIISFITEYFWVIVILFTISFILWKRYCWYQNFMKNKQLDIVIDNNLDFIEDEIIKKEVNPYIKKDIVKNNNVKKTYYNEDPNVLKKTYYNKDPNIIKKTYYNEDSNNIKKTYYNENSNVILPADLFETKNYSYFI